MIQILQYGSRKLNIRCNINIIGSTPLGDYYLLKEEYKKLDPTYGLPSWTQKIAVQQEFLRKTIKVSKTFRCVYCGKDKLKRGGNKKTMVTVDHFFPKSLEGIDPLDPKNFVIACSKCNGDKASQIYSLDSLLYLNHYPNHIEIINNLIEIKLTKL